MPAGRLRSPTATSRGAGACRCSRQHPERQAARFEETDYCPANVARRTCYQIHEVGLTALILANKDESLTTPRRGATTWYYVQLR